MTVYDRFNPADPATQHESVDLHEGRYAQAAEINELQSILRAARKRQMDAQYSDGYIFAGAQLTVDPATGAAQASEGTLYLAGDVRAITAAAFTVPTVGQAIVGVYLLRTTITHLQDPTLRGLDPSLPFYDQPGADRTHATLAWGLADSGQPGDFFPVYEVNDGIVKPRETAQTSAITKAIADYDAESSGGYWVAQGLTLTQLDDIDEDTQAYMLAAGRARIGGTAVVYPVQTRIELATQRNLATVTAEPTLSTTEVGQPVTFARLPVVGPPSVVITARKTVTIVHGIAGAADLLPDASVLLVESVTQGGTTFNSGADFNLVAGQIDWSPPGAEPANGTSYQATYRYLTTATPQNLTATGFTVDGALTDTLIQTSYQYALRRIDRLCMAAGGTIVAVRGVPDTANPVPPQVPSGTLLLATIHQNWTERHISHDGATMVSMQKLVNMDRRDENIIRQIAELRLAVDVAGRYGGQKYGQYADPLTDNSVRDLGAPQTAVIVDGLLQLPAGIDGHLLPSHGVVTLAHTPEAWISQTLQTGRLNLNSSGIATTVVTATLEPAVDRWSDTVTVKNADGTARAVNVDLGWRSAAQDGYTADGLQASKAERDVILKDALAQLIAMGYDVAGSTIRQRDVRVTLTGIVLGEQITAVTFGGKPCNLKASTTSGDTAAITFEIPAGVPEGEVAVLITGSAGTQARATYVGEAAITLKNVTVLWQGTSTVGYGKGQDYGMVWSNAPITL